MWEVLISWPAMRAAVAMGSSEIVLSLGVGSSSAIVDRDKGWCCVGLIGGHESDSVIICDEGGRRGWVMLGCHGASVVGFLLIDECCHFPR